MWSGQSSLEWLLSLADILKVIFNEDVIAFSLHGLCHSGFLNITYAIV